MSALSKAQDIHFSQYYFSPLSLNPAHTGNYDGNYRLMANYRSQWKEIQSAYKTISVGGDANFYPLNQQVSGGLYFVNDKSGGNLIVNKIMLSAAVHKKIAGFNIHAGVQPGYVTKRIDFNAHSFPTQLNWNSGQFDASLPNYESNVTERASYFDLNAGFFVSKRIRKIETGLGMAMFHLTQPNESMVSQVNKLTTRKIFQGDIKYYHSEKITVNLYSMLNATTKASDWLVGINGEYALTTKPYYNAVFIGLMWRDGLKRISDAAIATAGFKYRNYTFGFSYDVNVSMLHTATDYKGAIEFALIYTSKDSRLRKKQIPCDRY